MIKAPPTGALFLQEIDTGCSISPKKLSKLQATKGKV
jgi:hypothetical protein